MYKIFSIKFSKKMERMLLFSFSIEKNKLAGVNINQNRHRNAIQGRERSKAGERTATSFKALKCFISLKSESERIGRTEKTDPFFFFIWKKISFTSKLKNI